MSNNSVTYVDLVSDESSSDLIELNQYEESTEDSGQEQNVNGKAQDDAVSHDTDNDNERVKIGQLQVLHGLEDNQATDLSDEPMDDSLEDIEVDFTNKKKPQLEATFGGGVIGDKTALWSVQFNPYLPDGHNYFAAVGGNRVTIYECVDDRKKPIRLVDCFADLNINQGDRAKRTENYYTVCWSYDETSGNPLVICGGVRAVIRVIDCATKQSRHLIGHGGAINDLKTSPHDHNLILSSSEDHSIRLWNLKTCVCVVRFWGESGHRDQVICSDFYILSDKYFASASMDHSMSVWSLDIKDVRQAIKESYEPQIEDKNFPMRSVFYPVFSTRDVHGNYIDCVQFLGKWLLSKSLSNKIVMVKLEFLNDDSRQVGYRVLSKDTNACSEPEITYCGALGMQDNEYWFVKFSMDFSQSLMAIGNSKGITHLWDMATDDPTEYQPLLLKHRRSRSCIRQTSFNSDGTILICVSENSSIYRWNIKRKS